MSNPNNEYLVFGPHATEENEDIFNLEDYRNNSSRLHGHQEGLIDKRALNTALKSLSKAIVGSMEFLSNRHLQGVNHKDSPEKIAEIWEDVLSEMVLQFSNGYGDSDGLPTTNEFLEPIGSRSFKPWETPEPGYKIMDGSFIEMDDPVYRVMHTYLLNHPFEVIDETKYEEMSNTADPEGPASVGGVHYYAIYSDGRIRLPDVRGDFIHASGLNDTPLDWRVDAIRNIPGTIDMSQSNNADNIWGDTELDLTSGALRKGEKYTPRRSCTNSGAAGNGNLLEFDPSLVVPTDVHNHPRGAAYLPVVYVGLGTKLNIVKGRIKLSGTNGKYIGEVFLYDGKVPPLGAIELNGELHSRVKYKDLFNKQVEDERIIPEVEWMELYNTTGKCDFYSYGNDISTFRVPSVGNAEYLRNWPTNSICCVHAYSTVVMHNDLTYDDFIDDVSRRLFRIMQDRDTANNVVTLRVGPIDTE